MENGITDRRLMSKKELKKLLRFLEKEGFIKSLVFSPKKDAFPTMWWKISECCFSEGPFRNKIQISFFEYPNDMYRAEIDLSTYTINSDNEDWVGFRKSITSLDELVKLLPYAEKVFDLYANIYEIKP